MRTYVQHLGITTNDNCNLDCAHCLKGQKRNNHISNEIIETTLDQVNVIGGLTLLGGEPTLAVPQIEKIISYIVDKNIPLANLSLTINGTIYSEELISLLDYISDYIKEKNSTALAISFDKYHKEEILNLGLKEQFEENVNKYMQTKHFLGFRNPNPKLKWFREGNAINLDESLTVPLRPIPCVMSYKDSKVIKGEKACLIGPIVTVNTKGIVTDCDASLINQETLYNYGNILEDSLVDICSKRADIVPDRKFYSKCKKLIKEYDTYNN